MDLGKLASGVFPDGSVVKNLLTMQETRVRSLIQKIPQAVEQLSPCTATTEPVPWSLGAGPAEAHERGPCSATREAAAARGLCAATSGSGHPEGRRPRPRPHPGAPTVSPGIPRQPALRGPTVKKWAQRHAHSSPKPGQLLLRMGTRAHRLHAISSSQLPGARAGRDPRDGPSGSCPGPAPSTRRRTVRPRQVALALCLPEQTTALLGEKYPQLPRVFKYYIQQLYKNFFPGDSDGTESTCNAGDLHLIPGLGRSPGEGNGYPLQYSCLEDSMDVGAWWATVHGVTKSQTILSN